MAKVNLGIISSLSGSIGNVVGTKWKSIDCLRLKPDKVKNPKTEKQVAHRNKFKGVVTLSKELKHSVIQPIWNGASDVMTGYNLFVKKNIGAFSSEGEIEDFSKLVMSVGVLEEVSNVSIAELPEGEGKVKLMWDSVEGVGNADDVLKVVVTDDEGKEFIPIYDIKSTRADNEADLDLPYSAGTNVHLYVFFKDAKKDVYSPSRYFPASI